MLMLNWSLDHPVIMTSPECSLLKARLSKGMSNNDAPFGDKIVSLQSLQTHCNLISDTWRVSPIYLPLYLSLAAMCSRGCVRNWVPVCVLLISSVLVITLISEREGGGVVILW